MSVLKRDGRRETVSEDKILKRIRSVCQGLDQRYVNPALISKKVYDGLYEGVTTAKIDELAAETAAAMTLTHPDYAILAGRMAVTSLRKNAPATFSEAISQLYHYTDPKTGQPAGLIDDAVYQTVSKNPGYFNGLIHPERDLIFDYFGYRTLQKSYLLKMHGKTIETPQYLYLRVAVGLWLEQVDMVEKTYDLLSRGLFTHATPTMFNAGTKRPQLSSCFLIDLADDSIQGIFKSVSDSALISKNAGGIGISIHKMRAKGSYIKGTFGISNGIVPFLRIFNETARAVDQGGGKRKGSIAVYLEPWHADIFDFLDLRKNHGKEEMRARDLFLALWIPDLFMKRVKEDGQWTLFCPNEAPGLHEVYDAPNKKKFTELYEKLEKEGKGRQTIKARLLWTKILDSQIETGTPYMLFKDAANYKSNQKNLGIIKSSNLCTEIMEYTDADETAVCNLASIALPKFAVVKDGTAGFDHEALFNVAYQVTVNLNRVIDINYYPTPESKKSNLRHRPIGIGIQGLADLYAILHFPFESEPARTLNREIFETIYFAALTASKDEAKKNGAYETFAGSPASEGTLQFDLWNAGPEEFSGRWDWAGLKGEIKQHGLRNSLLLAPMPTASTAQILGNNECFEPFTSNVYKRNTLSGEYVMVNKHLVRDLIALDQWNDAMRNKLIMENGSVQNMPEIPQKLRDVYKTVWEIKQRTLMDLSRDRGLFICQSQSLNIFIAEPNVGKLTSAHFYSWEKGLKTGMYYLRSQSKSEALKDLGVTMDKPEATPALAPEVEAVACSLENPESCQACGS
ncbi:MAG: ribonucleoside-diphosphate reductase subunit alpha [Verrucomicrobiota bacterium]|nr:ribonucleoside-diphosphate reductase subunit alpha [Verrucomicrobiota bacterium]